MGLMLMGLLQMNSSNVLLDLILSPCFIPVQCLGFLDHSFSRKKLQVPNDNL